MLNAPGASQYCPLSQPFHFVRGEGPPTIFEKEKIEHIEERSCAMEGGGCYGFTEGLSLVLFISCAISIAIFPQMVSIELSYMFQNSFLVTPR